MTINGEFKIMAKKMHNLLEIWNFLETCGVENVLVPSSEHKNQMHINFNKYHTWLANTASISDLYFDSIPYEI